MVGTAQLPAGESALYLSSIFAGNTALPAATLGINTLEVLPFFCTKTGVINQLGFNVTVLGGAGSVARVGLYDADSNSLYPTTLLADGGPIATDAGLGFKSSAIAVPVLSGKLYYLAYLCGISAPTVSGLGIDLFPSLGLAAAMASFQTGRFAVFAFGALPTPFPAGAAYTALANLVAVSVRFA